MKGKIFEVCGTVKKTELIVINSIPHIRFTLKRFDDIELIALASQGIEKLIKGNTVTVQGRYHWQKTRLGREYILHCNNVMSRKSLETFRAIG